MRRTALSPLAAVVLLTACADMPPPAPATPAQKPAQGQASRPRPPVVKPTPQGQAGAANPAATGAQAAQGGAQATPAEGQTQTQAPAEAMNPEKLKGLDETQTLVLLGEPAGRAERPPARVWTYENPSCRLELAFYLDVSGRGFRVLSYDLKPRGKEPASGGACIEKLRNPRR